MLLTKTQYDSDNCFEALVPGIRELSSPHAETEKLWGKISDVLAQKNRGLFHLQDADIKDKIVR